jgi:hypothetical protein
MMDTENTLLTPEHDKVGSLVPKEDASIDKKDSIKQEMETFKLDAEFSKFIKDLWKKCEKLNELEWLRIKQAMIKSRKYFDGKQYGRVNDSLEWQDFEKRPGEVNYVSNVYHSHIQTALMELSRGSTSLSFTHIAPDSRRGQLVSKVAEMRYKIHKQKLMGTLKVQQENLSLLLNGMAARYTFVEFQEAKSDLERKVDRLKKLIEEDDVPKEVLICAVCAKKKKDEYEVCPNCGAVESEKLEAPEIEERSFPTGAPEPKAHARYINPDPIGLTFDLYSQDFKDSAFIIWKQLVLTDLLKTQYPSIKISEGIDAPELKYQYAQSVHTPNQQRLDFFMGEKNQKEVSEFCQAWFDPQLYKHISFKKDIELMSGVTIPAGVKLIEMFPDGMYVARNGESILDIWNEAKNDKWTVCPYVTRLGTLVGSGTSVAHDAQDIINDLTNLKMASIMQDAFSKEFVNAQYLEPENIPNDPTERAVVTNLPDGARIVGNAIDRLPPSPLSSDAYQMDNELQGMMQNQLGTFSSSSSGMPDLQAAQQTYGGMQLMRDITVGRFFPMLAVRADSLDKEQAYQLLVNDQKFLSSDQWLQVKGDYGADAVKAFLTADLREELIIAVTPESFMPEMPSQRLSKSMAFAEFVANFQVDPNSEMAAFIGKQFGIPSTIIGLDATRNRAYQMIDKFKEQAMAIEKELGDLPTFDLENPMVAQIAQVIVEAAQAPISSVMDDLNNIIDVMKDWWNSDEGRAASNVLKSAVLLRVRELQAAQVKEAQIDQTNAMMAQQPAQEMQAAQQAEAMAAEEEAGIAQGMKDMAVEDARMMAENRRLDLEEARLARDAEERTAQREHEFRLMMAQNAAKQNQSGKSSD